MNFSYYLPILVLLIIVIIMQRNEQMAARRILKRKFSRDKEETQQMRELAKRFIGKECIVYSLGSQTFDGTLTEVTDGALVLVRKDGAEEAINLDFVIRIREYPRKKNGKKKDVVID